ncbi:hypothetical protein ACJX0J_020439, partial [Zea mays]
TVSIIYHGRTFSPTNMNTINRNMFSDEVNINLDVDGTYIIILDDKINEDKHYMLQIAQIDNICDVGEDEG